MYEIGFGRRLLGIDGIATHAWQDRVDLLPAESKPKPLVGVAYGGTSRMFAQYKLVLTT